MIVVEAPSSATDGLVSRLRDDTIPKATEGTDLTAVSQPGTLVKEFGFGMAVAIVIDAFVTRMVMLPSFMTLGGRAMWWFPGRSARAESRPVAS